MMTSQPQLRKAVRLSARSSASHSGARSNAAFTTPIFRHTQARRSDRRLTSVLQRHRHRSRYRGADLAVARPPPNPHS
jgi:hypothetical protein